MADVWNIKGGSSLFPIPKPLYSLSLRSFCQLSTTCIDKSNIDPLSELFHLSLHGNWPSTSLYCHTSGKLENTFFYFFHFFVKKLKK